MLLLLLWTASAAAAAAAAIRDLDSTLRVIACNKTGQRVMRIYPLHECVITRS